jgi:two-component system response regulator HydG
VAHLLSLRWQRDNHAVLPLMGSSRTMHELVRQVDALARGDATTALLIGEPGTGKGRLAEYIHSRSARAARPFVVINCATSDATTLGAELFGVPDSHEQSPGLLDLVSGGTVLIEEVADLRVDQQERLFQALDAATVRADTDNVPAPRVIAAASKDLVSEVNAGRFREDLYYRLGVAPVHLPPLRARSRDDLTELITATFAVLSAELADSPRTLGEDVIECLIAYPWPGNIRELRNAVERAIIVARGESVLRRVHLAAELQDAQGSEIVHTPRTLMDVERAHIHRTLRAHKLNRTHAARELGISRATLIKKIKEYGLVYTAPSSP